MEFIDTHTHLYDEAFDDDRDEVIERAFSKGVGKLVFPDIDSLTRDKMFSIAETRPDRIFPALGLHPTSIQDGWEIEFEKMSAYKSKRIYAIGETGLDFYWSKDFIREQKEALRRHFRLAYDLSLPLIIHSREATGQIFEIMDECRNLDVRGVFHAFSGSIETFRRMEKYGDWYVGIGGVLTYKKASIAQTIAEIPLERIILETDSPYLPPVPMRGKRNESGYIPFVAEKIAGIKGVTVEEVAGTTTANAEKLFKI